MAVAARAALLSGIAMIACWQCAPSEALRILVISPLNSRSHDAMSDRLAKALAARGHQVDAYSHHPPKKPLANYRHHSLAGTLPAFTNNMSYSEARQFRGDPPRLVFKRIVEPVCELMGLPVFERLLREPPRDPAYDLVVLQMFVADCYLAWGRHLGAPLVGLSAISSLDWFSGALGNPFNAAITPAFATDLHAPMDFWQRLYNAAWSAFASHSLGRMFAEQHSFVERYFGAGYPSIEELRRDLDLLVVNSHYSLDGVKPLTQALVPAAGMHISPEDNATLPEQVQRWLDASEHGCVYFTFGSMLRIETLPRAALEAIYAAFGNVAPVRVLMKIARPEALPPGLPANVMPQPWFSQVQVFKHKNVKAFITHGGLMSSIEAISSKIPMIGIPIFGDQPYNVKTNVRKGIATYVDIDSITADKLTRAIKDVLDDPSYRDNMNRLSEKFVDRPMTPLDTAIYWVEYVARHGKRCLRSPLVDMPWWQANLLDVYAFVACVLILAYYILKFLVKKICGVCCASRDQSSSGKLQSKKKR
ncbi:UDP-glucosyltransferase 2-like isoform X2 [Phymastichus coffea]|nr:UDP-glucosyltransferase 2-like isoform X2 [Phymastichus coffea]